MMALSPNWYEMKLLCQPHPNLSFFLITFKSSCRLEWLGLKADIYIKVDTRLHSNYEFPLERFFFMNI